MTQPALRGLALAVLGCLAMDAAAAERRFAVAVGANVGNRVEGELFYAERDAERIADVFGRLGGVRPGDVVLVRGGTADGLRAALDDLDARVQLAEEEEISVFFYYSGHANQHGLHISDTSLPFDELVDLVSAMEADVHVIVVDACRSGGLTRVKGAVAAEAFEIAADDELLTEGTAIITSSAEGEDAQESDAFRGGVFTHHFVAGLHGAADTSGDLEVSLTEAYRYAAARTVRDTSLEPVVQHPTYAFDLRGKGDLVLTRLEQGENVGTLHFETGGEYLVFEADGSELLVTEFVVADGGLVSLQPGNYLIRRRGADHVADAELRIRAGESGRLALDDMVVQPYGRTVRRGEASSSRALLGLTVSGGIAGPLVESVGVGGTTGLGLRLDLEPLTLFGRVRYGGYGQANFDLNMQTHVVSADVGVMKLFDVGRSAPGLGIRGGFDGVFQRFSTAGDAPNRSAFGGHLGPVVRYEIAPSAAWVVGLEAGADAAFLPLADTEDDTVSLSTRVVPHASLDFTFYPRRRKHRAVRSVQR